jgi:MFS family permease
MLKFTLLMLSRTATIVAGAVTFGVGAALEAGAKTLAMFIAGRVIAGIGEGLFLGNVVTYVTEIAPARRRGRCGSLVQFAVTVGIAAGYFISYG